MIQNSLKLFKIANHSLTKTAYSFLPIIQAHLTKNSAFSSHKLLQLNQNLYKSFITKHNTMPLINSYFPLTYSQVFLFGKSQNQSKQNQEKISQPQDIVSMIKKYQNKQYTKELWKILNIVFYVTVSLFALIYKYSQIENWIANHFFDSFHYFKKKQYLDIEYLGNKYQGNWKQILQEDLQNSLDGIIKAQAAQMILVYGESGVGKSTNFIQLVNDLQAKGQLVQYIELSKGLRKHQSSLLMKLIFWKTDYEQTKKELQKLIQKKKQSPILIIDNIHYLNENTDLLNDFLSILKMLYDRGLSVIFLTSSLQSKDLIQQAPGFEARLRFFEIAGHSEQRIQNLYDQWKPANLGQDQINIYKKYFDGSLLKLKEFEIWANNIDQFLDEVRQEFHEKLNALFEIGSNDDDKIHRILSKLAKKNIHQQKNNEWWMLSGYNQYRFEKELNLLVKTNILSKNSMGEYKFKYTIYCEEYIKSELLKPVTQYDQNYSKKK